MASGVRRGIRWWEWIGLELVLIAAGVLLWFGGALAAWLRVGLWFLLGVALLVMARGAWLWLFGPVPFYDSIRSARRGRYFAWRCIYLAVLLLMLFFLYGKWFGGFVDVFVNQTIDRNRVSQFAEEFFFIFISLQFIAAVLFTPALTAGAIAEERQRKTLEYLLATDLGNHEIVLGKLVSRLGYLTLFLLTGLPMLSLLQFLGGVDPSWVLAGFTATALTMFSLAGLSIFFSVFSPKPLTAIFLTYFTVAVYVVLSSFLDYPTFLRTTWPEWYEWLEYTFTAGNIWLAVKELSEASKRTTGWVPPGTAVSWMTSSPWWLVAFYGTFHFVVGFVCILAAFLPLRVWAKASASARGRRAFVVGLSQKRLPVLGHSPMEWKELYAEPMFRFNRTAMVVTSTFVFACLVGGAFLMIAFLAAASVLGDWEQYGNRAVRLLGTFVACLFLTGTALRAAGCLTGERDRDTLVSLLTTPISNGDIIWAKWWGSVLSGRKLWWYLAIIWIAGVVSGGLHPIALLALVFAWAIYSMFLASLGLWFSLVSRSTLRATIWTLLTVIGISIGPVIFGYVCNVIEEIANPRAHSSWTGEVIMPWLSPPVTLYTLEFYARDFDPRPIYDNYYNRRYYDPNEYSAEVWERLLASALGLATYTLAAALFWMLVRRRFAAVTGRMPVPGARPRRPPADRPRTPPAHAPPVDQVLS
jgi:ABC-type transport system involved in multi-copper enzyme maturation permease subunit